MSRVDDCSLRNIQLLAYNVAAYAVVGQQKVPKAKKPMVMAIKDRAFTILCAEHAVRTLGEAVRVALLELVPAGKESIRATEVVDRMELELEKSGSSCNQAQASLENARRVLLGMLKRREALTASELAAIRDAFDDQIAQAADNLFVAMDSFRLSSAPDVALLQAQEDSEVTSLRSRIADLQNELDLLRAENETLKSYVESKLTELEKLQRRLKVILELLPPLIEKTASFQTLVEAYEEEGHSQQDINEFRDANPDDVTRRKLMKEKFTIQARIDQLQQLETKVEEKQKDRYDGVLSFLSDAIRKQVLLEFNVYKASANDVNKFRKQRGKSPQAVFKDVTQFYEMYWKPKQAKNVPIQITKKVMRMPCTYQCEPTDISEPLKVNGKITDMRSFLGKDASTLLSQIELAFRQFKVKNVSMLKDLVIPFIMEDVVLPKVEDVNVNLQVMIIRSTLLSIVTDYFEFVESNTFMKTTYSQIVNTETDSTAKCWLLTLKAKLECVLATKANIKLILSLRTRQFGDKTLARQVLADRMGAKIVGQSSVKSPSRTSLPKSGSLKRSPAQIPAAQIPAAQIPKQSPGGNVGVQKINPEILARVNQRMNINNNGKFANLGSMLAKRAS